MQSYRLETRPQTVGLNKGTQTAIAGMRSELFKENPQNRGFNIEKVLAISVYFIKEKRGPQRSFSQLFPRIPLIVLHIATSVAVCVRLFNPTVDIENLL